MTSAQNIQQSLWFNTHFSRYVNGVLTQTLNGQFNRPVRRYIRPASVNNVVREDHTRAPSGWVSRFFSSSIPTGRMVVNHGGGTVTVLTEGIQCAPSVEVTGDPGPLLANTRLKALSKATDGVKQFNAALAQANGVLGLCRRFCDRATNGLNSLMDGKKGLAKKLGKMSQWKEIPSDYLAYSYGLAPLGDDIANGLDRLNEYKNRDFAYSMLLKHYGKQWEQSIEDCPLDDGFFSLVPGKIVIDRKMFARCCYRFDLPLWFIQQTPVIAPFSTAYELTRYSFVLDWFLPLGDWFGALESAQFSPYYKEGSETTFVRESWNYSSVTGIDSPPRIYESVSLTGSGNRGRMSRVVQSSLPVFHGPALKPFPGLQQAAQGLSLLTQAFQRWS